jgi:arabinan endo-1,5-alpha-L-arabinosidase
MRPTVILQRSRFHRVWPAAAVFLVGTATLTAAPAVGAVGAPAAVPSAAPAASAPASSSSATPSYVNPVSKTFADTYADPSVIRGKDGYWYAYGTTDPLREGEGTRHLLPISRSKDLVNWSYVGDAFTETTIPAWADTARRAALWAPDIHYVNGEYRLYYVVTDTTVTDEPNDNAIGMATAEHPAGPWKDSGAPVVGPRRGGAGEPGNFLWTFDPDPVTDVDGSQHLYYGSYYGGIFHTRLDDSGTKAVGEATQVAIDNKFEGAHVVRRGGYWYLFASTANCCAGPTTGYSVHVGRSKSLTGPFVDREGVPLTASRAGGTPVLYQNGNRWIGAGHNAVVRDLAGQDWIVYHAIDRADPYLDGTEGINERPMLIDRLDWFGGWPVVRFGCGPSETRQQGPVTQRGQRPGGILAAIAKDCPRDLRPGRLDRTRSDEFNGSALKPGWETVRTPSTTLAGGELAWPVEAADLVGTGNNASLLLRRPPAGDWTVETKVNVDLGVDTVRNFQQGGLIAYVNDDLFTRLSHVAIWNTRQTEFGKEMPYAERLSYGGTIVGPPAETTWLRITARTDRTNGERELTPFTSRDGRTWTRGGTWTLPKGADIRIGLVSHGRSAEADAAATARFDYFRVYTR